MGPFLRARVRVRELLNRDLLSARFYWRRARKNGFVREAASFLQMKVPYAFPLPRLPFVIGIEPTTFCNLRCIMCPSPALRERRGYMSLDLYRDIVRQAAAGGTHRLRFVGLGEPLLHPAIAEMVHIAKRHRLYTEISTNATLLTEALGDALLDAGLDEIGFSLDSTDPAEYERIRKGASFDGVVANVERFLDRCAARGSRRPITVARMVVLDRSQIDPFARRWAGRVDSLQLNVVRLYARSQLVRKGRATRGDPPSAQLARPVRCRLVRSHMPIAWDGRVCLCNQSSVVVGDATTTPLAEIWRGIAMEHARRLHARYLGARIDVCRACPVMEPALVNDPRPRPPGDVTVRRPWQEVLSVP